MKSKTMLKKSCLCLAVLATLFTGCSKDNGETDAPDGGKGKLVFKLSNPGQFILRAASEGQEGGGPGDKIAFYQFSKEGTYEQCYVFDYKDATSVDDANNTRSYELELNSSTSGEKRFIIVESRDENNFPEMQKSDKMADLINSTTVEETGILKPPFLMSNAREVNKEYVTVTDVESTDNQFKVKMKRRVARFDLLNDPAVSGVTIDKIYIKNRPTQGFICDANGKAGNLASDILEIPITDLANNGKSFYLYPTSLTSTLEQNDKTVIWATTKLATADSEGPTLYLDLFNDMEIQANYLYQLNTKNIAGSANFDITVEEWKEGTSVDWVTVEDGISTIDNKAQIIEGKDVKGTYVKITPDAKIPYTIKRVVTNFNDTNLEARYDGSLPSWLTISSSTSAVGSGMYRHEIVYKVTERPTNEYLFAVTYLNGMLADENLLVIGFSDPYPGTPLPCLSWGSKLYSPIHAKQSTYLKHNGTDKAYFCGAEGYTFYTDMASKKNDVAINPCPEGWKTLNDAEAKDYILWVGEHLKSAPGDQIFTYLWFEGAGEATYLRTFVGYPKAGNPTLTDLAAFGTWPNVAWVNIRDLKVVDQTFGNEWVVNDNYGIPYRCIRDKAGWN